MPSLDSPMSLEKTPQQTESWRLSRALQKGLGTISPSVWVLAGHCWGADSCGGTPREMFCFQGGRLQCTGHSGACVAGQQWMRGLRTVELRVCGSKQISVKGNNFSQSYAYIKPVVDLFAGYLNIAMRTSLRFALCHSWSPLTEHTGPATPCFQDKCALAVPSFLLGCRRGWLWWRWLPHTCAFFIAKGMGVKESAPGAGFPCNLLVTFTNNALLWCCFLQIILITTEQWSMSSGFLHWILMW